MSQQPTLSEQLNQVLTALLEQCQPATRAVIGATAGYIADEVAKALKAGEDEHNALAVIQAEQKAKGEHHDLG